MYHKTVSCEHVVISCRVLLSVCGNQYMHIFINIYFNFLLLLTCLGRTTYSMLAEAYFATKFEESNLAIFIWIVKSIYIL